MNKRPEPTAPEQIRAFIKAEKEKWMMLVKAAGIDPE
jgi:tripartite-type tricarboxylate transporter receptor subunit TctC